MDVDHEREFEAFVRARSTALLRTAYLLTGDQGHAEDLLQSVLVKVARQWPKITGPAEPYARRALANAAVDRWRRRRLPETPLEDVHLAPATGDCTATIELRDELVRGLFALSPRQRAVLVLRYFEDKTEAEIAQVLGCSPGAVKGYASRGLARLRELPDVAAGTPGSAAFCLRSTP